MSTRVPAFDHANQLAEPIQGFTLIELAIVLFIITLILGGALTPISQLILERQNNDSRRAMEAAQLALVGYALRHAEQIGPLPCPEARPESRPESLSASNADGLEDRLEDGRCLTLSGNLPWRTLGLAESDAWGNHFGYAVAPEWTHPIGAFISTPSSTESALTICLDKSCSKPMPAAAVLVSYGRNGFGASNANGNRNLPPNSHDEIENADENTRFIRLPPRHADHSSGEFDDLVLPISSDWLRGRLCEPASRCQSSK